MSTKSMDRRVRKTREALAHAMAALIQREHWNAITVRSICEEADVARASFYAHFEGKVSLLEFMLERNLAAVATQIAAVDRSGSGFLQWMVEHVTSDRTRFAKIVLSPDAYPILTRFKAAMRTHYHDALRSEGIEASDAQVVFIMGGMMELVMEWSKTWRAEQVPALCQDVRDFAAAVLDGRTDTRAPRYLIGA